MYNAIHGDIHFLFTSVQRENLKALLVSTQAISFNMARV